MIRVSNGEVLSSPQAYDIFVAGRSSYPTPDSGSPDGFRLLLSAASINRAIVAADLCASGECDRVIVSGGWSEGLRATNMWPALPDGSKYQPAEGTREADMMAGLLKLRLKARGWSEPDFAGRVVSQGNSSNTLGDIVQAVRLGMLDPSRYDSDRKRGLVIVADHAHKVRIVSALVALGIDPSLMYEATGVRHDLYGNPQTKLLPAKSRLRARVEELGARVFHYAALRNVRPGDVGSLAEAEARFVEMTSSPLRALKSHKRALGRAVLTVLPQLIPKVILR